MTDSRPKVFISYSTDDRSFAERVTAALEASGIRCWLDVLELKLGASWIEEIEKGLDTSAAIVFIPPSGKMESKWLNYERQLAARQSKPLYVLQRSESDHAFAPASIVVDFRESFDGGVRQLTEALSPFAEPLPEGRSHLPPMPERFVGRRSEKEHLTALLTEGDRKIVLLIGDAGMGKTSLATVAAHDSIQSDRFHGCVWIQGAAIAHPEAVPLEVIRCSPSYGIGPASSFAAAKELLNRNNLLIVIDGLDEASQEVQSALIELLRVVAAATSESRALVTTRPYAFDQLRLAEFPDDSYSTVALGALTEAEARQLFSAAGGEVQPTDAQVKQLVEKLPLAAGNPALITTIAALLRDMAESGTEPQTVPLNLEGVIDAKVRQIGDLPRRILEAIARTNQPITARALSALLGLHDTEAVDRSLRRLRENGLIRTEDGPLNFTHLAIREYFQRMGKSVERDDQGGIAPGTLYVTFDPSAVAKEDVVEVLEVLNAVYQDLGGDELVIREDAFGRFSKAGVLV